MNRSFLVPAAVALGLHAMLFVGSGQPPKHEGKQTAVTFSCPKLPDKPEEILLKKFEEILEEEKPVLKAEEKPGGGNGEEAAISVPEMPTMSPIAPFQITQDQVKVAPGKNTKIPSGFTGLGSGDGEGPGSAILSAAFLDNPPATRRQTPPIYPHAMKMAGVEATVWVEFVVDENGRVHDVRVTKTTNDAFNDATITAVTYWRFEPGKRKGLPVRFRMSIPIIFSLSD